MFSVLPFKLCTPDFKIGLYISQGKKREILISNSKCAHKIYIYTYVCLFLLCMKNLMCEMQLTTPHSAKKQHKLDNGNHTLRNVKKKISVRNTK